MDAVSDKSRSLLLRFIHTRNVSLEESVEFHNDMVAIYINYSQQDYELIRDSAKACMKIGHLMTLGDTWFRSRSLLFWTLYILDKGVISTELADDMILAAFRTQLTSYCNCNFLRK